GAVMKIAFVLVTAMIGIRLLIGRDDWRIAEELPGGASLAGYGFAVGLASSLMGTSGGSVATSFLTLHGKSIHNAVATSAAIGVPITLAGTDRYMLSGLPPPVLLPPLSIGFVSTI